MLLWKNSCESHYSYTSHSNGKIVQKILVESNIVMCSKNWINYALQQTFYFIFSCFKLKRQWNPATNMFTRMLLKLYYCLSRLISSSFPRTWHWRQNMEQCTMDKGKNSKLKKYKENKKNYETLFTSTTYITDLIYHRYTVFIFKCRVTFFY